jgi:hypothetical protein
MDIYGWETSDGRRVLYRESAVRDLRQLAIAGFTSLPRRGLEVGGLLFGAEVDGETVIEASEPTPCEHRYGPSFALSEADRTGLRDLIAERRSADMPPLAGFFRSFTGRDPIIEEADESFIGEQFPQGDFLYLMLQPISAEKCVASARFFRDGRILPETEDPPAPFDLRLMRKMQPAVSAEPEPAAVQPPEVIPEETPASPPLPPAYRSRTEPTEPAPSAPVPSWAAEPAPRRDGRWMAALALLFVIGIAGGVYYELNTPIAPRWTDLHLDARPIQDRLEISWDAAALRMLNATRGTLSLTDAAEHREVNLDSSQVRAAKYSYAPVHGDISVRLILYDRTRSIAGDAVRVATVGQPQQPAQSAQPQAQPQSQPVSPAPATPPAASPAPAETRSTVVAAAVPPSTVHEVQPRIPEGIRSRITDRVVIPVEVQVNEQGRVTYAQAEQDSADGVVRYLADQARKAAREWRFRPARTRSGARVASSKTIEFVFTR